MAWPQQVLPFLIVWVCQNHGEWRKIAENRKIVSKLITDSFPNVSSMSSIAGACGGNAKNDLEIRGSPGDEGKTTWGVLTND
jgi:hypothetical protein